MELSKFILNVTALFEEVDAATITNNTNFKEIEGWSSLTALSIIAMVDEEYNVKVKGDDIRNSKTIEDLFNIVNSRGE